MFLQCFGFGFEFDITHSSDDKNSFVFADDSAHSESGYHSFVILHTFWKRWGYLSGHAFHGQLRLPIVNHIGDFVMRLSKYLERHNSRKCKTLSNQNACRSLDLCDIYLEYQILEIPMRRYRCPGCERSSLLWHRQALCITDPLWVESFSSNVDL